MLSLCFGRCEQQISAQIGTRRLHKGTALVWIGQSFQDLGWPTHAKRYVMLSAIEDAITFGGKIDANNTGCYFRLVWQYGMAPSQLQRYASEAKRLADGDLKDWAEYPEAILQRLDHLWMVEQPSPAEGMNYFINRAFASALCEDAKAGDWRKLELLAEYLMSCMPGCRAWKETSQSTDYDVICSLDGHAVDFRSEFGRYFICECKNWNKSMGFEPVAKFLTVLWEVKSRFGIIFSREGISGEQHTTDARRALVKAFQSTGTLVVVIDQEDLQRIAAGENLIMLLRREYERLRFDLPRTSVP